MNNDQQSLGYDKEASLDEMRGAIVCYRQPGWAMK